MIICLSFVGVLPEYIVENIHQIRCYYDEEIYLITNDLESIYLKKIEKYDVIIVDYNNVISNIFTQTLETNRNKFCIVNKLIGREELFIRCIERFFLLQNLLKRLNKNDCLFLELDNLIYDDPRNWVDSFSKYELCYMYDNEDRCASGLMYIKNAEALEGFLNYCLVYINSSNDFLCEMIPLSRYYEINKDTVGILPTYWVDDNVPPISYLNYNEYNDTIFDAAAIGIYLFGSDPFHTSGKIVKHFKAIWSKIDYTNQLFDWRIDLKGRKKPYIWNGEKWLLINVLHIHSKELKSGLSTILNL
jgi:hypothetical protein